jgi:hypothetical protein
MFSDRNFLDDVTVEELDTMPMDLLEEFPWLDSSKFPDPGSYIHDNTKR